MNTKNHPTLRRALAALTLSAVLGSAPAYAINAIVNDNFTSDTAPWSVKLGYGTGAAATLTSTSGWGRITFTNGGTSKSHVNLEQTLGQPLVNGVTYTIAFDAYADATKSIDVLLRDTTAIYTANYGVSVLTTPKRFSFTYTHTAATASNVDLSFRIGSNTTTLYVDNVVVARQGQPSSLITKNATTGLWDFNTVSVPVNGSSPTAYKSFNAGAHDFSYAGYNYGEREAFINIPANTFPVALPVAPDDDITQEINDAVAAAASAGGGTVMIPAGTFYIGKGLTGKCIVVSSDNTVLKGAGMGVTTLVVHPTYHALPLASSTLSSRTSEAFGSGVITFARGSGGSWYDGSTAANVATVPIASATIPIGSRTITVTDPSNTLASYTGPIVIRQIMSRKFTETYAYLPNNQKKWRWSNYLQNPDKSYVTDANGDYIPLFTDGSFSLSYFRKVLSQTVSGTTRTLNLDVPIPHKLVPQEFADSDPNALPNPDHQPITVAKKTTALLSNCGLQDITLTAESEDGVPDEDDAGATLMITGVYNGLFKNVDIDSFRTLAFAASYPINTSFINCTAANALNTGGGGAGYGFYIKGQNLLYKNCNAINVRHGYTTAAAQTSNIVIKNCTSESYRFRTGINSGESIDDTHLQYAHGILWDNHYSNNAGLLMINRAELSTQAWETCGWGIVWNYENEGNNSLSPTNNDIRHNLLGITPTEFGLVIGAHAGPGRGLVSAHDKNTLGIRVVDGYTRINGDSQQYDDWGTAITTATAQVGGIAQRVMFEQTGQPVTESIYDIQYAQRAKLLP